MSDALLSTRPRLHPGVKVHPQVYRGDPWYLLQDESSGEQLLADQRTWQLLELIRRGDTLQEALARLRNQNELIDEQDAIGLIATLSRADLLDADLKVPIEGLLQKQQKIRKQFWQRLLTPFSVKVALIDPDRLLSKLAWLPPRILSTPGMIVVAALIVYSLNLLAQDWAGLQAHWQSRFIDPVNLATLIFLYPLVKGLHELGHGLAAKYWGAEVHEMGLMFLVFMPVPYVDASHTTAFYSARHRMAVAAAGIVVELILSAAAIVVWHHLEPGLGRDLCFNVAIIGGISTLLFNGNPLLRFDGYYVFADAIQIPNLATRSQRYLGYFVQRWLLRLRVPRPGGRPDEYKWLLAYAVASGLYRIMVGLTIALYVAGQFLIIGLLLAAWFVVYQMLRPLVLRIVATLRVAATQAALGKTALIMTVWLGLLPLMFFNLPVPHHSVAHGILLPPESSLVRAPANGFIGQVYDQNLVTEGEQLVLLENPELAFQQQGLEAKVAELEGLRGAAFTANRSDVADLKSQLDETMRQLNALKDDRADMNITSKVTGRFSLAGRHIAPGRYVKKGDLLGYLSPRDGWIIQALIDEASMPQIMVDTQSIRVAPTSHPSGRSEGLLIGQVPQAVSNLPHRALGSLGGGPIPVDATETDGTRLLQPMFQLQVKLPDADYNIGQTFVLRFEHTPEAPGQRWVSWLVHKTNNILYG